MENFGDQQALLMHQIAETWIKGDENLSPTLSKSKSLFSTKKVQPMKELEKLEPFGRKDLNRNIFSP